ncbi:MAG: hypothetical protein WAL50_22020 [Kineosporiaceae bacterium]
MTNVERYEAMAEAAERGELRPLPGTALTGQAATEAAHADLMAATGAATIEEAVSLALGRPRVGHEKHGSSPTWRVRTTPEQHQAVERLARQRGESVSTVIRHAVAAYLNTPTTR